MKRTLLILIFLGSFNLNAQTTLDIDREMVFSITPNPARSELRLQLHDGLINVRIEVFDVLGKKIYANVFTGNPINISNWSKGVYLVRVSTDDKSHTKRFVKQ
jgi:hypothetical protein